MIYLVMRYSKVRGATVSEKLANDVAVCIKKNEGGQVYIKEVPVEK